MSVYPTAGYRVVNASSFAGMRSSVSMRALLLASLALPGLARAEDAAPVVDPDQPMIVITAQQREETIENAPSTSASVDAGRIAEIVNAVNTEDALKYLPSLFVRKRHVGDTQAPLATRTNGGGASARSLIYADGALLSALIGNNNSTASPKWGLVSPQEIERVDVLYGPFSAAYPGNSIGAVVNITTRLPEHLEATATAGVGVQKFEQYGTRDTLPSYQFGATVGDRFGPFAFFLSANQVTSNSNPLVYATALRPNALPTPVQLAAATPTTGAFIDVNRLNQPIAVLGAGGLEHQRQNMLKAKVAFDITDQIQVAYVGGIFLNDTESKVESYVRSPTTGAALYSGPLNINGYVYNVPASTFSNSVYTFKERHFSHTAYVRGRGDRFDWQVIGTAFDYDKDIQRIPTGALPGAFAGGAGNIVDLKGTGWRTFDAKGVWRSDADATHSVGFGFHHDRFRLQNNRYTTTNWISGPEGALNLASRGRTETNGVYLQDEFKVVDALSVTLGGRYEWWRAYDGFNFTSAVTPARTINQPELKAQKFSPKASLTFRPAPLLTFTASFGQAYRFPTVSELYQTVASGPNIGIPNPNLRPERARSEEFSLERRDSNGNIRLTLFNEVIDDALISQTVPYVAGTTPIAFLPGQQPASGALVGFIQNIDRTRARGVEFAFDQRDILNSGFDLAGSYTYVDATIRANAALPVSVGKRTPTIPKNKWTLVGTYHPDEKVALTVAAKYSDRQFATIDNVDVITHTYQGFDGFFVVDLRAKFDVTPRWSMALGIDNVNNDKYFIFHPFPQRSFSAELNFKL